MSVVAQENEYDDEIEMVLYHESDVRTAIEAHPFQVALFQHG